MSLIADITDAVVTALNGGAFSQAFTAVRAYAPLYDLQDMATLRVTVVPRSMRIDSASRSMAQHDLEIDVAVQKKLAAADNAEIDDLMDLTEEIALFGRATGRFGVATWVKTANAPIYLWEHLGEKRQFTSVVTFTLRAMSAG